MDPGALVGLPSKKDNAKNQLRNDARSKRPMHKA